MPLGHSSADHMTADLDGKIVVLNGHARLHITQQKATSPK
jgi:lipopolysaccharide export system protein LptC